MMMGELDYSDKFYNSSTSYTDQNYNRTSGFILYLMFATIMTIIVMNLLVGLAVGDIIEIQQGAAIERIGKQIKSSLDTEYFLPIYFRRKLCKKQDVIKKELTKTQQFIVKYLKIQKNYFLPSILKKYQENKIDDTDVEDDIEDGVISPNDQINSSLNALKSRFGDLLDEQTDLKQLVTSVYKLVASVQNQAVLHTEQLKLSLSTASIEFSNDITDTQCLLKSTTDYLQNVSVKRLHEVDQSITTQTEKQLTSLKDEIKKCLENFFIKTKPILSYIENSKNTIEKQVLMLKNIKEETESCSKKIESNNQNLHIIFKKLINESENKLAETFQTISKDTMLQFENRVLVSTLNLLSDKKTMMIAKNKLRKSASIKKARNISRSTNELSVAQPSPSLSRTTTRSDAKQKKFEQRIDKNKIIKSKKHMERSSTSIPHNITEAKSELGTSNLNDNNSSDLKKKIKAPPSSPTK